MNVTTSGSVESKNRRLLSRTWVFFIVISIIIITSRLVSKFSISNVWDDAYIFVRYSENVLTYWTVAWNPGDIPTFGLTSNLFLGVVLSLRLLINQSGLVALLASVDFR